MQRRPLNISAALAIAIERQVEDLIANAKRQCALQSLTDGEADRRREFLDALRSGSEAPRLKYPVGEPPSGQRLDIWKRLQSLFTPWPFRG
jgi:hypothetical protein